MAIDSDLIRGHVDTIILKTLAGGDKYGYEIIKEIETRSNGTYELKQPTLYSCLKRLEGQGFISAYWVNSDIGGKRHYYKLTDLGRQEYDNNMREWLSSRSIIDNLIAENADNVLPEVTTNFVPLTGTENMTFRQKTDEEKEPEQDDNLSSPLQDDNTSDNLISEQNDAENYEENQYDNFSSNNSEELKENETTSEYVNPFAEFYGLEQNDEVNFSTDEQDLKLVEEYYNSDENQFDIFNSINENFVDEQPETEAEPTESFEDNDSEICNDSDVITSEENILPEIEQESTNDDTTPLDDVIVKEKDCKCSTKFNFKDYKLNNDNYFSNVKDEIGGSGFGEDETGENNTNDEYDYDTYRNANNSLFDEIINSNDNDDFVDEEYNDDDFVGEENKVLNALEDNDDFEITRRFDDFTSNSFDDNDDDENLYNSDEDYTLSYTQNDDDNENNSSSELNFGFSNEDDEDLNENSRLIFGTEEENIEANAPTPFVRFNYNNFNSSDEEDAENSEDINPEDEIANYSPQNFTMRNEEELTESYNYDYDREEVLSDSREVALREDFGTPAEDPQNEVMEIKSEVQSFIPIYNDPDATTNLFVDNKRSFVPQYTDNESKQLLNTLSSYGSIRFSPTNKTSHTPKHVASNMDELKTNFTNAGIEVRVYERRPKETAETKNYILTNKIKMFTSWLSFASVSLLLVIGYLIAGPIGYTNLNYVPTSLPASFYLFVCLGVMLSIPITFTVMFLLNQTKKVKPKYSAKVAIIFAILFAVQCLVIIYAINIPFGLYSFTQIDYNHLLWYLPAICTLYLPIYTLVYTLLFNSKRFHV